MLTGIRVPSRVRHRLPPAVPRPLQNMPRPAVQTLMAGGISHISGAFEHDVTTWEGCRHSVPTTVSTYLTCRMPVSARRLRSRCTARRPRIAAGVCAFSLTSVSLGVTAGQGTDAPGSRTLPRCGDPGRTGRLRSGVPEHRPLDWSGLACVLSDRPESPGTRPEAQPSRSPRTPAASRLELPLARAP
jgi:hypothetical protein